MADDIAQLKQLQAGMNAAFESFFAIAEKEPTNAVGIVAAKEEIAKLGQTTSEAALGPAVSVMRFSLQVRSQNLVWYESGDQANTAPSILPIWQFR